MVPIHYKLRLIVILYIVMEIAEGASITTNTSLACYDCSESFKYVWEPYTECQTYPKSAPLRTCLGEERYCMVERVSFKSMTVSITRSCTRECWHGCYASGFGFTKLKCTSCCLTPGCNVGDGASGLHTNIAAVIPVLLLLQWIVRDLCFSVNFNH